jgi:hypothetical protein
MESLLRKVSDQSRVTAMLVDYILNLWRDFQKREKSRKYSK